VSAPEILSMEEVREIATSTRCSRGVWNWQEHARLCATVEHWHREAQGKASVGAGIEALKGAFESTVSRDTHAEVVAERDRLRALVAGMREALGSWQKWEANIIADDRCWSGSAPTIEQEHLDALTPLQDARAALLADPDGRRAHDLAAKDREAAEKWRALMAEAEEHLKEPEHAAFIEKATAAIAEGEEELRLLRDLESIASKAFCSRRLPLAAPVAALAAFRARQKKGTPK
jgi:hypothetical protein